MNSDQVAVIIPAYNEAATIVRVVEQILTHTSKLIVIDDCSTDQTAELLQDYPITFMRNEQNLGKAGSLMVGIQQALKSQEVLGIITLDGDAQHDPADIPTMLKAATRYTQHIIIGARLKDREQAPKSRLFANKFADFWISWAAGNAIADSQSGFRYYPRDLLQQIDLSHDKRNGFVFESEILIESAWRGFQAVSIAIASCYPKDRRPSYFKPGIDISKIVLMVAKKILRRFMNIPGLIRSLTTSAIIFKE